MESESKLLNISKCERSDKLCRICLRENASPSKCLHEALPGGHSVSPASMVMAVARVEIRRQDGLPDTICEDCLGELEAAHGFRLKCERSDGLLRKLYLKQQADDKLHLGPELPDMINIKEEDVITRIVKLESDDELNEIDPPVDDNYSIENDSFAIDLTKKNCKWLTDHLKSVSKTENNFSSLKVDRVLSVKTENKSSRFNSSMKGTGKRIKQNNRVSFICDVCGKPMKSERNLQHHKNRMHSEERRRRTGNKTGYGANKRFHCPECPYSTSENRSLKYHIRTHTGDKPHKCELCSACFAQPSSLKKHTARHSDVMHYSCTICGKQFKLKGEFQRHKSVHSDVRPHICLTCSKGFKSKDSLAIHVKRHLNIRDYSCDQCGTTFVCLSNLIHHRKCHAATKDFECDYCGFRSISKPKLIDHIKRHISERPFKCELCDYAAIEKFTLKSHMRKHTREMNYSCPICHLKMTRSTGVNKHMLRAHGIHYKVNDHRDRRLIK